VDCLARAEGSRVRYDLEGGSLLRPTRGRYVRSVLGSNIPIILRSFVTPSARNHDEPAKRGRAKCSPGDTQQENQKNTCFHRPLPLCAAPQRLNAHREASASALSASRLAFCAASRAPLARICAPMIRPPQITSRDLVLMAAHYSAAIIFTQSTRSRETRQVRHKISVNLSHRRRQSDGSSVLQEGTFAPARA
jgi:hypothetical protein